MFITAIRELKGCPVQLISDLGTENGLVASIQSYLERRLMLMIMLLHRKISVLKVGGRIMVDIIQFGGEISFMIWSHRKFWIHQVNFTWNAYRTTSLTSYRGILILSRIIGIHIKSEGQDRTPFSEDRIHFFSPRAAQWNR